MAKYVDTFYRISTRAYMYDGDIEYTGEQLMLALLLRCKGVRSVDAEREVGALLDDPNQQQRRKNGARSKKSAPRNKKV